MAPIDPKIQRLAPEGVTFTKQLTRKVNDKNDIIIFIGRDKDNNKVRYAEIDGKMKELVATETTGKNTYTTRDEFEAELMQKFGMSSKDFAKKGVVAEYKHGKITFTHRGNQLSDEVIAQLEAEHQADLAQQEKTKLPDIPADDISKIITPSLTKSMNSDDILNIKLPINNDLAKAATKSQGATSETEAEEKIAHKPKGMTGTRAVGPEVVVVGQKARVGRLNRLYPPTVAIDDKRMKNIGSNYVLVPPKSQGTKEPAQGYDMYEKVKAGDKEILVRSNLTPEQKAQIVKAEEAKQAKAKAEAQKQQKATEEAKAKRQELLNKGRFAGKLNGYIPDRDLDVIIKDIKSLDSGTVRTYMEGYNGRIGNYPTRNFFSKLWATSHYGKTEDKWKAEKLDLMYKILGDFAKTSGAKQATFEKTVYKKPGVASKETLTLESVMKELQEAKANIQKGIPVDETVRDVERIMSRFGYGNANA